MTTENLTPYERKTLELLSATEYRYPSAIGHALFAEPQENRKANASPQGMALAAGKFLARLRRRGLIYGGKPFKVTPDGKALLKKLEADDRAAAPHNEGINHEK